MVKFEKYFKVICWDKRIHIWYKKDTKIMQDSNMQNN